MSSPLTSTAYMDVTELAGFVGSIASGDQALARRLLQGASRRVDEYCRRWFYQHEALSRDCDVLATTQNAWVLNDDLLSLSAIAYDVDDDGTFSQDVMSEATRLVYEPDDLPYYQVTIRPTPLLAAGQRRLRFTGTWGWPHITNLGSGDTVQDNPLSAGATTLTVTDSSNFAVAQTLVIEDEQVFVSAIPTSTTLTIERGVNGTTAASHAQTTSIAILKFAERVFTAVGVIAARLYRRRDTAFAPRLVDSPTIEPETLFDSYVSDLLEDLRKKVIA